MPNSPHLLTGLNSHQVTEKRRIYGANNERTHSFTTLKIILKTIFSVFNIIMIILIIIMFLINQGSSARFIGFVATINTLIELIQEIRAYLIIKKLNKTVDKSVQIVREEKQSAFPVKEIVIGDTIHLSPGDRVVVDGKIQSTEYVEFDESILTGESQDVQKKIGDEVYAGSFVASGSCYYIVTKLSRDSYIQTLTKQLQEYGITESPLQSQISQIIKALTFMTIFFIILIVVEGLIQENQINEIIINSATLVTSLVPQGLVLITTLSFAYGAMKIARNHAIVQRLSSIEAMANAQVICMDKTGTLTKNDLEVQKVTWL